MKVLLAIYADPEMYPPTLNTTIELSKRGAEVHIVGRHFINSKFNYPELVKIYRTHKPIPLESLSSRSKIQKISYFLKFIKCIRDQIKTSKYDIIIAHDLLASFAVWMIKKILFIKETLFWYHSHDVVHKKTYSKFSVMALAKFFERKTLNSFDVFSLPVRERLAYYPLHPEKKNIFIIPNYPRKSLINNIQHPKKISDHREENIRLIYQGSLGTKHGFEDIIKVLRYKIFGKPLSLTLIGPIAPKYKKELLELAKENKVVGQLHILEAVHYTKLLEITSRHHIGLAIHLPGKRAIYNLGATSSNKIYEYIALGLPVLLYDTVHYRKYLDKYAWSAFTSLKEASLVNSIKELMTNYLEKSKNAICDFNSKLNYELVFDESWKKLEKLL